MTVVIILILILIIIIIILSDMSVFSDQSLVFLMDELTLTSCSQGFFQLLLSRSFNILSVDLHVIVPEVVGSILQSVQSDRMSLYLCV